MSMRYDKNGKHIPLPHPVYDDGRTKQTFKDETDINKILKRAQKSGTISHLNKHQAHYGDFSSFDFETNMQMLTSGREMFDDLPSEVRNEFDQSPAAFFKFVNDPKNKDDLARILPGLAEPGKQNITPSANIGADAEAVSVANEQPSTPATPPPAATTPATAAPAAPTPPAEPPSA